MIALRSTLGRAFVEATVFFLFTLNPSYYRRRTAIYFSVGRGDMTFVVY